MNKVRRGDFPTDLPVSGMPASLRGRKLATPLSDKGPSKERHGNESGPRRNLTGADSMRGLTRQELTATDSLVEAATDE